MNDHVWVLISSFGQPVVVFTVGCAVPNRGVLSRFPKPYSKEGSVAAQCAK